MAERATRRPDLVVDGPAHPQSLYFICRMSGPSGGVELRVSAESATLTSWAGADTAALGARHQTQPLGLDLTAGFQWAATVFPDAPSLARALVGRMEREMRERNLHRAE